MQPNVIDNRVPLTANDWTPGRGGNVPQYIVLHTSDCSLRSAEATFASGSRGSSAHRIAALDGSVVVEIGDGDTAWHAANWWVNQRSFGLEHEDNGNFNDSVRTDAEYAASAWQVAQWCRQNNIPCKKVAVSNDGLKRPVEPGIVLHGEVSLSGTACPDGLDWQRVIREAQAIIGGETQPVVAPEQATVPGVNGWGPSKVRTTVQHLRVHTEPNTQSPGNVGNVNPDGMLHQNDLFDVNGWVRGETVTQDGVTSNVWLHTIVGHYVWAPDTDFPILAEIGLVEPPVADPAPLPEPAPAAPQAPATPPVAEFERPYTGTMKPGNYITVSEVVAHDFEGKTGDRTIAAGVVFPNATLFSVAGVDYIRSTWSLTNNRWIGLDSSKFASYAATASTAPVTGGTIDGIQAAPQVTVTTDKATQTTTISATNGAVLTKADVATASLAGLFGDFLKLVDAIKSKFGRKK